MTTFIATLLNVESECSPEYSCIPIEAEDEKAAEKQAKAILEGELHHMGYGWSSYRDEALWGKPLRKLIDVVPEADHVKRSGRGNQRGEEGQNARFERYRKAAKA